ncbi:hypothetical protein BGZ80_005061 [Entomortierella chlamydospora]|uniref:F-box domain-containing protein n=1 Tax=Entomortierella chlamydospora TaxID=101097 RepID=A0A9P6SVL5_9FUNG|nr:hypothetical protein BGZ80_005061 [Entomortierella chlamydospora]
MISPTPITLPDLPIEIFESILERVSQPDLASCVRVSRAWHKALIPYLWRTLAIGSNEQRRKFDADEAQKALRKYASLVRDLHVILKKHYDQFLPAQQTLVSDPGVIHIEAFAAGPFSNLDSLELCSLNLRDMKVKSKEILALVRQNPRLRRLKIDIGMDPSILMSIVTKYLPTLQDLDLNSPWRGDVKTLLMNLPEGIQTVRLGSVVHEAPRKARNKTSIELSVSTTMACHHHALKTLCIDGNLVGHEEEVLLPFLASCSRNLKSVCGTGVCLFVNSRITNALSALGIVLDKLDRHSLPQNISDADLAKVISSGYRWTSINLYTYKVGPLTAAAIVDNCRHLEALEIMNTGSRGLSGSHLQAILSEATALRSLQAHWLLDANKIAASDILSSEWATISLEHIDLKIDLPRADEALPDNSAAIQASRYVQRLVLQRLGQQTKLRKLVIGGMATTPATGRFGHQRNCLEMTLESGLDELVGLKDLEELDIHHMDHRAGVPELEWMVANLPRLRTLIGMLDTLIPPSNEVRGWLETHRPTWR